MIPFRLPRLDELASDLNPLSEHAPRMSRYLKAWREALGFTLTDVSAKINRHFTTVQKWETGRNAVGTRELMLLAEVYKVPWMALTFDPIDREHALLLQQAYDLIAKAQPNVTRRWLEAFADAVGSKPPNAGDGNGDGNEVLLRRLDATAKVKRAKADRRTKRARRKIK